MVAITVILAALVASFVLGLGGDDEVQPNTALEIDYQEDFGGSESYVRFEITVTDGDRVDPEHIFLRGEFGNDDWDDDDEDVDASLAELDEEDPDEWGAEVTGIRLNAAGNIPPKVSTNLDGEETLSAGQSFVIEVVDITASEPDKYSLAQHDFDIVWDTDSASATLDSTEGPEA